MPEHNGGETIQQMIQRHEKDLYRGNGLPGLCTRVKSTEDDVILLTKTCEETNKRLGRTQTMFYTIIVLLLSILATTLVDMLKPHEQNQAPSSNHSFND